MKRVPEERRVGEQRERQSWKAGGSALNGQHPSRKTRSQAWHIAPQLHPAVAEVHKGKGGGEAGGGIWTDSEDVSDHVTRRKEERAQS